MAYSSIDPWCCPRLDSCILYPFRYEIILLQQVFFLLQNHSLWDPVLLCGMVHAVFGITIAAAGEEEESVNALALLKSVIQALSLQLELFLSLFQDL